MTDDDDADTEQPRPVFFDFPEAVVGRGVQVLLLDRTWRHGRVESVTPDSDDPYSLGSLVLSTGSSIPGQVVAAVVCAN